MCRGVNSFSRKYLPPLSLSLPTLSPALFLRTRNNREIVSLDTGGRARWLFRNRELETDVGPIVDLGHGLTRFGENLRPNLFCSFSFFFFLFLDRGKIGQIWK